MRAHLFSATLISLASFSTSADAQSTLTPNSADFYKSCLMNLHHESTYDCSCLAHLMLPIEKENPEMPASHLYGILVTTDMRECLDYTKIKRRSLNSCKDAFHYGVVNLKNLSEEDYCECIANETVEKFRSGEFQITMTGMTAEVILICGAK